MAVASQPVAARLVEESPETGPGGGLSRPQKKKRPGTRPGRRSSKLCGTLYFAGAVAVAAGAAFMGAGAAVVASVFVMVLFVEPSFFVTFLDDFFVDFL